MEMRRPRSAGQAEKRDGNGARGWTPVAVSTCGVVSQWKRGLFRGRSVCLYVWFQRQAEANVCNVFYATFGLDFAVDVDVTLE